MKVLHLINSLKKGGAEGNLFRLCMNHKKKYKNKIEIIIITLLSNGYYEKRLIREGIKVFSLNLNKKDKLLNLIRKINNLRKYVNKINPDIIQTWMYHSNFLSLFINKTFRNRIYWNIRHSELNYKISKKTTILVSLICGLFSKIVPKKIIYCSETSIDFHENNHFYLKKKSSLINNGYSHKSYYPSLKLRLKFRKKYKIKKSYYILGYAGRYSKQKNIESLIISFSKLIKEYDNVYLYMAGKDINSSNKKLFNIIKEYKIQEKVMFLDEQKNLLEFYNGIDLLTLTSHSESFPNVVAESMLCATPVISSDAGCAKKIINNYGFFIKKNNINSIYRGLKKTIKNFSNKKNWQFLKKNSQAHIKKNFSVESMGKNYLKNWIE